MDVPWLDVLCAERLRSLEQQTLLRQRQALFVLDSTHVLLDGRSFVNFASNSYLGLTHHPRMLAAAREALAGGVGAGASALVSGYSVVHCEAEAALAAWKGSEAAVLLPSGYQAAHAAINTFSHIKSTQWPGVRYLLDKLSHASLIDAVQASRQPLRIFPHNGMTKLERLLADSPADQLQVVVTESIFSMDGDAADLAALVKLKRKHRFALVLDEAHGSGVYGTDGAGYAAEMGVRSIVDVSIVTLSKALGAAGGAVCASQAFCDALVNLGRPYIYSTSVPAVLAASAKTAIGIMRDEPGRQARLRSLARDVRSALRAAGLSIPEGDSPIIPVILGSEADALRAAWQLGDAGLLVGAIRPPTVPRGTSRLRITLSCDHTNEDIARLIEQVTGLH